MIGNLLPRKKIKKILDDIEKRSVSNHERFNQEKIINEYFEPKTLLDYLLAEKYTKNWLNPLLKERIWKHSKEVFVCIDRKGEYGIAETPGEVAVSINIRRKVVEGAVVNTEKIINRAKIKNLLPRISEKTLPIKGANEFNGEGYDKEKLLPKLNKKK